MRLTPYQLVQRLKWYKPACLRDVLEDCGVTLRFISSGQFRSAYRIVGTQTVLKVPHMEGQSDVTLLRNIRHARQESTIVAKVLRSKRKYVALQPYMPEVYYASSVSGISLMRYYRPVPTRGYAATIRRIRDAAYQVSGHTVHDLGNDSDSAVSPGRNLGRDEYGNIRIIDLGWFLRGSK